jgi:hypothetical protein
VSILAAISALISSEVVSATGAAMVGALVPVVSGVIKRYFEAARLRKKTESDEFESAIASDHLPTVGAYLRNNLGGIGVKDYLNDSTTQDRVNRYVKRLDELVKLPEGDEATSGAPEATSIAFDLEEDPFSTRPNDSSAVASAINKIRNGESWAALASLRRDLERRLTKGMEISEARRGPPYRYVENATLRALLRAFWFLASRAVHGEELNADETALAIKLAREIYSVLEEPVPTIIP